MSAAMLHGDVEREAIQAEGAPPGGAEWSEPERFDAKKLPAFPVSALSPWLRDWVIGEATATQTPPDLAACIALGAASLAVARVYHVEVRPGWNEPTNLWLVVALPPGERKSAVFNDAKEPVFAYMRHAAETMAPQITARASERRVLQLQVKEAEAAAGRRKTYEGIDGHQAATELLDRLEKLPELRAPVLLTDDVTPEALAILLAQHGERMGIFSAEGGPFELMAGRYSEKGNNFEIFLKSHPGDHHIAHRVQREPVVLQHPLVTFAVTVQPGVLQGLHEKEAFRRQGLLARFLYSLPKTALGSRLSNPPPLDPAARDAYNAALVRMLAQSGAQKTLRMTAEADEVRSRYQGELEPRLGDWGDLRAIGDWANKLVGTVCRIAGVLHVADHAAALDKMPADLPAAAVERAILLGDYFLEHAVATFNLMEANPDVEMAKRVWAWIERKDLRSFSQRDAGQALRARAADVVKALAILVERHLVREQPPAKPTAAGRPAGPSYAVNPLALRRGSGELR
ncbi:MAG TPA: YfjI family protein [Polyangiaceae bacterium]|nr:YfjI family protein [Polyangiaceae bacterium]